MIRGFPMHWLFRLCMLLVLSVVSSIAVAQSLGERVRVTTSPPDARFDGYVQESPSDSLQLRLTNSNLLSVPRVDIVLLERYMGKADLQETWIADRRRGRSIGRDNGRIVGRRGLRVDFFLLWYPGETRNNCHARWHFRINQWGGWHGGRRGNRKRPMGGNPRLENQQD